MFTNNLTLFNPDVAFDGWAIAIIVFILTALIGTNHVVKKRKVRQRQIAGSGAKQSQTIKQFSSNKSKIIQSQKAKDNSNQTQSA